MKHPPVFGKGSGNWKFWGAGCAFRQEWFQTIPYKTPETQNEIQPCLCQRLWQLEI
jgi:hypothetical protein